MTREIRNQILAIRDTGLTNMFDINRVQALAVKKGYTELAQFIADGRDDHRYLSEYVRFILNGAE